MTIEEREEITELIKAVVVPMLEQQLLLLVETYANVTQERIVTKELVEKFYKDNPDFVDNKDIVQGILEKTQAGNPGLPYTTIIQKATPDIRRAIDMAGSMEMTKGTRPLTPTFQGDFGEI